MKPIKVDPAKAKEYLEAQKSFAAAQQVIKIAVQSATSIIGEANQVLQDFWHDASEEHGIKIETIPFRFRKEKNGDCFIEEVPASEQNQELQP